MGIIDNLRTKLIIKPLAEHLRSEAQKRAETEKAATNPAGAVIRDQLLFGGGSTQYGSTRSKPGSAVDFKTLRRFSEQYDVARAVINRRKRQLSGLDWDIVPVDPNAKPNPTEVATIKTTMRNIGGYRVRFREFVDTMVEDLLVLDALAVYKQPNRGGGVYALRPIDASTITLKVDKSGNTPEPPEIAYIQKIRGEEVATFTADEMYYEMMNPRTSSPYGFSPLESLILVVSTALKSDVYNLHLLTEGNIPEGLYSVPENWTTGQIKEFQEVWDAALAGNTPALSKLKFTPPGTYHPTMKPEDMRYKDLQEWLMKKTCMLYEIQPQELGFTETVNKSTGEVQQSIGHDSGLMPLVRFFEELLADVIQIDLDYPAYRLKYMGVDDPDPKEQAETNEIKIRSGQATVDELRTAQGEDPIGVNKPFVIGSPTFLDEESIATRAAAAKALIDMGADGKQDNSNNDNTNQDNNPPEDISAPAEKSATDHHIQLVTELRAFRKYAIARKKDGKNMRYFTSQVLPEPVCQEMNKRLQAAPDVTAVKGIFHEYMQDYQINFLANVAALRNDLAKVK